MRCGCSVCSAYMVQLENGLKSGCVCPECGNFCSYCMGTVQQPKTADELAKIYSRQIDGQAYSAVAFEHPAEELGRDWRKRL